MALGKALAKAGFKLRREVDLGHHHQRLRFWVALQQGLHGVQVDLGLAAARGAKQQKRAVFRLKSCQSARLLCGECYFFRSGFWSGFRRDVRRGCRWRFSRCFSLSFGSCGSFFLRRCACGALEPACDGRGVKLTQLWRQRDQRHFTQGALVVAGAKVHQLAPGGAQRRDAVQYR